MSKKLKVSQLWVPIYGILLIMEYVRDSEFFQWTIGIQYSFEASKFVYRKYILIFIITTILLF